MSYVSIWKPVRDKIVKASTDTENETVGLLLGRLQDDTIVIEESITDEYTAEPNRVKLPPESLAKIADGLVTGRIKGNIVGWYHSHTEGGLFFSETDIETQRNLQQFSTLVTGMVVDARNGETGFFRVDPRTGDSVRIAPERINVFSEESEAVPLEAKSKPRIATPAIEVRQRAGTPLRPSAKLVVSVVLIILLASLALVGALLYSGHAPAVVITHRPIAAAIVGVPIDVTTNVTGQIRNVTLTYAGTSTPFTQVLMNLVGAGRYDYVIPGNQVGGNIVYHISAFDSAGNMVTEGPYAIAVADFNVQSQTSSLTVYRNSSESTVWDISLLPVNGFSEPISFAVYGISPGIQVNFAPNPAPPATTTVQVAIAASSIAHTGTTPMTVAATYTPPESTPVTKQVTLQLTVADFGLQVNPDSNQASVGSIVTYTISVALENGFIAPVMLNVLGLPQGSSYQLTSDGTLLGGGPRTVQVTLQIHVSANTSHGTYSLTVTADGAGVLHSQTILLIVR